MAIRSLLAVALLFGGGLAGRAAVHALDYASSAEPAAKLAAVARPASPGDGGTLREARVPAGRVSVPALADGDELDVRFFRDFGRRLVLRNGRPLAGGGRTFQGHVAGDAMRMRCAVVLQTARGLQIHFQDPETGCSYAVSETEAGVRVRQLRAEEPSCEVVAPPADSPVTPRAPDCDETPSDGFVDLLVVLDKSVQEWMCEREYAPRDFVELQVEKMNLAVANSGLDGLFKVRLRGFMCLDESLDDSCDLGAVLSAMRTESTFGDVDFSGVRARRDEVGADIVALLTRGGTGASGVSFGLRAIENPAGHSERAYCVCKASSAERSHTLTHEIGHILGAGHAAEQTSSPGPQSYDYSSGYYFFVGEEPYCTIMAYPSQGTGGQRIPYYSSPSNFFQGVATGDALHDNARAIANLAPAVSRFRPAAESAPEFFRVDLVRFVSSPGEVFGDRTCVDLVNVGGEGEIRYTLDGSEPTVDAPLYSGTIQLQETTKMRAAVFFGGDRGRVYETMYCRNDPGDALDTTNLEWHVESDSWIVCGEGRTGLSCMCSRDEKAKRHVLTTEMRGPGVLSFDYRVQFRKSSFQVLCDECPLLTVSSNVAPAAASWQRAELEIPAGRHVVSFICGRASSSWPSAYNGVYLDGVSWVAYPRFLVTFDGNYGDDSASVTRDYHESCAYGDFPFLPCPEGMELEGWYTAPEGGEKVGETDLARPGTLYAHWRRVVCRVRFNDAMIPSAQANVTCEWGAALGELPVPARNWVGKTFGGWFTGLNGSGERILPTTVITNVSNFFHALWTPTRHEIVFDPCGGVGGGTVTNSYGSTLGELPVPERAGYEFLGWSTARKTGGALVTSDMEVWRNAVFYAQWRFLYRLHPDDGTAPLDFSSARIYDGVVLGEDGGLYGTLQIKLAKGRRTAGSDAVAAKVSATLLSAQPVAKSTFRGDALGTEMVLSRTEYGWQQIGLRLDDEGGTGTFGNGYKVDMARNVFAGRSAEDKARAAEALRALPAPLGIAAPGVSLSVVPGSRGKLKVLGTVDGARVNAKSQLLAGRDFMAIPVIGPKKTPFAYNLWLTSSGDVAAVYGLDGAETGPAGDLARGACFRCPDAATALARELDREGARLLADYLPDGIPVGVQGTRWTVADGAKPGRVAFVKGSAGEIDAEKVGENPSGLKLTYKAADGSFKGTFKVHAVVNGRIRSFPVAVSGVLVNGRGRGTAVVRRPALTFPVRIE